MNYLPLLLLSTLIYHIAAQGCGCRGSSSCGQGGCGTTGGCSGGDIGNNYAVGNNYAGSGSYQRDEGRGFRGSLERLGSKRRRGRHGKKERRGRKYDDDEEEEDDDKNSVNYDSEDYDDSERRRKPAKVKDPKKRRFRMKRAKRDAEPDSEINGGLCNSLLIRRGLETGMTSLLNSNQTTPLALSPASSLHALMKTRSKKAPSPWGIICGPADALDQLDLSIDTKMYCYQQVGDTSCFAFKVF